MPNKRSKRGNGGMGGISRPPQLRPELRLVKTIRFVAASSGSSVVLTAKNFLQLFVVALTASTSTRLLRSIRLIKMEAWSIGAIGGASEDIRISGIGNGPANTRADASMGVTPAHVTWRPAPQSRSALWYDVGVNETDELVEMFFPTGAIVDVTLDLIIMDISEQAVVAGPVPASAAPGAVYCCTLDGNGLTGALDPVDYTTLP